MSQYQFEKKLTPVTKLFEENVFSEILDCVIATLFILIQSNPVRIFLVSSTWNPSQVAFLVLKHFIRITTAQLHMILNKMSFNSALIYEELVAISVFNAKKTILKKINNPFIIHLSW